MFWKIIAWAVSRPWAVDWLIRQGAKTPYRHIKRDGAGAYMWRYWLFNPYAPATYEKRFSRLPSIRLHKIMLSDLGPEHNHPWTARSIILRGWYQEQRGERLFMRMPGDTFALKPDDYHRITHIPPGGCWTLFFTWEHTQNWGFRK